MLVIKTFPLLLFVFLYFNSNSQSLQFNPYIPQIANPQLQGYLNSRNNAIKQQNFSNYMRAAYQEYQNGRYSGYITYSNYALKTGYSYPELYYYRGIAFEQLGEKKQARQSYKKAYKQGVFQAKQALMSMK